MNALGREQWRLFEQFPGVVPLTLPLSKHVTAANEHHTPSHAHVYQRAAARILPQ